MQRGRGVAGGLLDVAIAQQVDVQLGTDALQRVRQSEPVILRPLLDGVGCPDDRSKTDAERAVVNGGERNGVVDHDGLDGAVQDRSQHRILETANHHRLVNKPILLPAQFAKFLSGLRRAAGPPGDTIRTSK